MSTTDVVPVNAVSGVVEDALDRAIPAITASPEWLTERAVDFEHEGQALAVHRLVRASSGGRVRRSAPLVRWLYSHPACSALLHERTQRPDQFHLIDISSSRVE